MTKKMRLTRELVDRLPSQIDDPGPVEFVEAIFAGGHCERTANEVVAAIPPGEDLWVFAIGSLIWNPRCNAMETRTANVKGWERKFCLGPDIRYRGNPDTPGLMLTLDMGGACDGVVLRISAKTAQTELVKLLETEPPIPPVWVDAQTPEGTVKAIAFVVHRDELGYVGGLSDVEVAENLALAVGMLGSMPDYLLNTIENLEAHGIHDPYLWEMQDLVAARLEQMQADTSGGRGANP